MQSFKSKMRLIILGPPGSGKGTQAKLLSDKLGIPAISVGELLREEVKMGTRDGETAQKYMVKGEWVPHELTFNVLKKRLKNPDVDNGFILDAFPRLSAEYHQLGSFLVEKGWDIDAVINLNVSDLECIRRIQARAEIQASKGIYRPDVDEETTLNRIKIHHETSSPILKYYNDAELLTEIDASGPIGLVQKKILTSLGLLDEQS